MKKNAACALVAAALSFSITAFAQTTAPDTVETAMVKAVDAETPASITLLEKLVNINSGTMNLAGVVAVTFIYSAATPENWSARLRSSTRTTRIISIRT